MATAAHAAARARLAASVMAQLANVQVVLDGAPLVGHFKAPYGQALGGIATLEPVLTLADADVSTATTDSVAEVDGIPYRVRSIQPSGGGLTRLVLELTY